MALHTELPIYQTSYELLRLVTQFIGNFPRTVKSSIGQPILDMSAQITLLVAEVNAAVEKVPLIEELLRWQRKVELMIRLAKDMRFISLEQYAQAVLLTDSIGKQANGWRKKMLAPAA